MVPVPNCCHNGWHTELSDRAQTIGNIASCNKNALNTCSSQSHETKMSYSHFTENSIAAIIAHFLRRRGVQRVFGLCGGHIMPIWMCLHREGISIIDARDERAAVHMAQAHADITGELGVALVTAGPGVTNAITGIANAHLSRTPLLVISGTPPTPQENRGALQDLVHTKLVDSITRYARTVREPSLALHELDQAVAHALGEGCDPGPTYLDFPTDVLRREVPRHLQLEEHLRRKAPLKMLPSSDAVQAAVDLLWSAKRPLVITGRGARSCGQQLVNLLDKTSALYLDSNESRGVIPDNHSSVVTTIRGKILKQADVIVTVGRKLDFQLAYGSPAIFGEAKFLRIADAPSELRDNRRGEIELFATPALAIEAILEKAADKTPATDMDWVCTSQKEHAERTTRFSTMLEEALPGKDGLMHPNRLLGILRKKLPKATTLIADGGDFLSFARIALTGESYLDPGSMGCLGVGIPFGIAASLARPDQMTVVATGDGAFGFNAIEIDTAVRHQAPMLIVVANNGAWQIETHDQQNNYGTVVGTRLQFSDYAAMARSFGMYAERIERCEELGSAIDRAMAHRPALLDVLVTPEAISSDTKSGLAVVPDLQPLVLWDTMEKDWRSQPPPKA